MPEQIPACLIDFETRSFLSVKDVGAWRYAEDSTTEILCMAYRIGEDDPGLWVPHIPFPQAVIDHVLAGGTFEAHNVQFERAIWLHILSPQFGVPIPTRWRDTLAVCAHKGIPLGLDAAGSALNLPIQKDKRGKYLLNTLSVPKGGTKAEPDRIYREDWDLMDQLYEYCLQDVNSEKMLGDTLGELPTPEYRLWCLDQKINQRGVKLDLETVETALSVVEGVETALNAELREITGGEVEKATQRDKMLTWFRSQDLPHLPNLKKETIEELLVKDKAGQYVRVKDLAPATIRALEIRSQLAKASTKKLTTMTRTVSQDGRVRGLLQYHGASTGRWCLTGDHEVLTAQGWVPLDKWTGGAIAVWNENEVISFQKSEKVSFPYKGTLLLHANKRMDQLSTPDHKMPSWHVKTGKFQARLASTKGRAHVPYTGFRNQPGTTDENLARVLIMVQADGHYTADGSIRLKFKKKRKIQRCIRLLRRASIPFSRLENSDNSVSLTVKARYVPLALRMFSDKTFGSWFLQLDPSIVFNEIEHWDAYRCGPNSIQYSTTNKQNADMVQALAHLSGRAASIVVREPEEENWNICYCVNIWLTPSNRHELRGPPTEIQYTGNVYCASTPTGYFLVRRNGKVWVTGNSGRLIQPQNFPRALFKEDMDTLIMMIKRHDIELLDFLYGSAMDAVATSLRGMFIAEEGKVFRVCDFSAIEARVVFWVANCQIGLDVFHKSDKGESEDIYCVTASDLVGFEVLKAKHDHERLLGKVTVLGCFEADTPVLTNRGWVRIVDVKLQDKLWDGEAWVTHEGLLYQGRKQTIHLAGIGVTPDHMIMTQDGWVPAAVAAQGKRSYLKSALEWAGLRLPVLMSDLEEVSSECKSSVAAEMNAQSISQTYGLDAQRSATSALKNRLLNGLERMKVTGTSCVMTLSEICGLQGMRLCSADATNQKMQASNTTAGAESKYAAAGTIEDSSSLISKRSTIGSSRLWRLIGSTMMGTTNLIMSVWRHDHSKPRTVGTSDVYDLLNVGPRHRFTVKTNAGLIVVSNCGYQMGWSKLQSQAEKDHKVILEDHEAQDMVNLYRDKYQEVKWLWYGLNDAAIATVKTGRPHSYNCIVYDMVEDAAGRWLTCVLPNGRRLWYYEPVIENVETPWGQKKDSLTYMGRDNKRGGAWGRVRTYGGMLCLAADTQVLTNRGWLAIVNVQPDDLLWDGVEWVSHEGLVYRGEKRTMSFGGARMTPDHEVLTDEGWITASDCDVHSAYSTGEALGGATIRKAFGYPFPRVKQFARSTLALSLRLRREEAGGAKGFSAGRYHLMRVRLNRKAQKSRCGVWDPQNVKTSGLFCMAFDDGPLSAPHASSMEELWWPWDKSVQTLASVSKFLGRYGRNLRTWVTDRTQGQRWGLRTKELLLGNAWRPSQKSPNERVARHPQGADDVIRSQSNIQHKKDHSFVATSKRLGGRESVYDLVNAGPRRRFMIAGQNGMMIVHNCENVVQAIARDLMVEAMIRVEQAGYPIVLTVHDEIISEDDEDHGSQSEFEELMAVVPAWAEGCPIAVEGASVPRYQKV